MGPLVSILVPRAVVRRVGMVRWRCSMRLV
jgi:hypothetical protein